MKRIATATGLIALVVALAAAPMFLDAYGLGLMMGWMGFCILAKRCHDRNHSAWFLLIGLIPLANLWLLVNLFFWRGTRAANRFGPEPEGMASQWRATNGDR